MPVTKEIVAYKSYKENGYEVQVRDNKKIIIVCPPYGFEWNLEDLPEHRSREIESLMKFVEADLQHSFTPPTDELE